MKVSNTNNSAMMNKMTSVFVILSLFCSVVVGVATPVVGGEETNGQRLARGLPPKTPRNILEARTGGGSGGGHGGDDHGGHGGGGHGDGPHIPHPPHPSGGPGCPNGPHVCCAWFTGADTTFGKHILNYYHIDGVDPSSTLGVTCTKSFGFCQYKTKKACCQKNLPNGISVDCEEDDKN